MDVEEAIDGLEALTDGEIQRLLEAVESECEERGLFDDEDDEDDDEVV